MGIHQGIVAFSINDPPPQSAVFHDWLSSVGYDIVLYEEDDTRSLSIRDRVTWATHSLPDRELAAIRDKVAAFTRFLIAEFFNAHKSPQSDCDPNAT